MGKGSTSTSSIYRLWVMLLRQPQWVVGNASLYFSLGLRRVHPKKKS